MEMLMNIVLFFSSAFNLCDSGDVSMFFHSKVSTSGNLESSTNNGLIATFTDIVSHTWCGGICVSRGTCLSFITDNTTGTCQIFDRMLWRQESPTPQPGAINFEKTFFTCPSNYIYYLSYCIKMYNTPASWMAAHEQCQKDGGLLFHTSTLDRHNYYKSIMNTGNVYHIGGYEQSGTWIWTTGALISDDYINMVASMSPGLCLTVDASGTWQWDAVDCNSALHEYLCEISVFSP
ncbi:uncharacterized protein [Argopecten irradians]|uniref:uncharacterized protein n=1 Tax=Argopecten irradians TaxID=31199 RepID=UPI0037232260